MKNKILTTSWDDGDKLDLKLAEILYKYGLKGTFYIPAKNEERKALLNKKDVLELSKFHEIGSHTMNHVDLTKMRINTAIEEIKAGNQYVENITGKMVKMFCFPKGYYNKMLAKTVKNMGFKGARTIANLYTELKDGSFLMPVSLQMYTQPVRHYFSNTIRNGNWPGLRKYIFKYGIEKNWVKLAIKMFEDVEINGGVFHIWGHSWEIEENNLWKDLEIILAQVSRNGEFKYLTNSDSMNNTEVVE